MGHSEVKKIIIAFVMLVSFSPAMASSAATEFWAHRLNLDSAQIEQVGQILSDLHISRKALRRAGIKSCESKLGLLNTMRDKMSEVLTESQLSTYDRQQNSRYEALSCR